MTQLLFQKDLKVDSRCLEQLKFWNSQLGKNLMLPPLPQVPQHFRVSFFGMTPWAHIPWQNILTSHAYFSGFRIVRSSQTGTMIKQEFWIRTSEMTRNSGRMGKSIGIWYGKPVLQTSTSLLRNYEMKLNCDPTRCIACSGAKLNSLAPLSQPQAPSLSIPQ